MKKICLIAIIITIIDQLLKISLLNTIGLNNYITIIDNFFNLTLLKNTGAAFSLLTGNTILLVLISIFAITLIYFELIKGKKLKKIETIFYGIILGGIIGNLVDRIMYGGVIDYLDFIIFNYNFPVFNFADTCIVISIIVIIISTIWSDKHGKTK